MRNEDAMHVVAHGIGRLNPVFEHRMRLAAGVLLSRFDALSFSRLKELLGATDGNLGAQMRTLEEAKFVAARKEFRQRKPITWYTLTPEGRGALREHLSALETLINGSG
jgi:DNA-binding HxlR family transcriptional regulator